MSFVAKYIGVQEKAVLSGLKALSRIQLKQKRSTKGISRDT
jgi:hypothetical protein